MSALVSEPPAKKSFLLEPFTDERGRILSINPASLQAIHYYDKQGRLEALAYDNGYYDQYVYDDAFATVEVVRQGPEGESLKVYRYQLAAGFVDVSDAATGDSARYYFDIGDRAPGTVFAVGPLKETASAKIDGFFRINPGPGGCGTGKCICPSGDDHSTCAGNGKRTCALDTCTYKQNDKNCVWRNAVEGVLCL